MSSELNDKWMSVKLDKLPKKRGYYIVYSKKCQPTTFDCYFDGEDFIDEDCGNVIVTDEVTHWIKLSIPKKLNQLNNLK